MKSFLSIILTMFGLALLSMNVVAQRQIELDERWGFITPCKSTKYEVEKILGDSITKDKSNSFQTYSSKSEKLTAIYSSKKEDEKFCNHPISIGTVLGFFVYIFDDIKLSELKIDLSQYKKDASASPKEIWYTNETEGITIITEKFQMPDTSEAEIVSSIDFRPKIK